VALRISKASDHALRAMIYLACFPDDRVALCSEIAATLGIPGSFMAKVLRRLAHAGVLCSSRGVHGGFRLGRPAAEISMLDILEAVEGPPDFIECAGSSGCPRSSECPASLVWARIQEGVNEALRSTTLEDLVSTPRRKARVCGELRLAQIGRSVG
jgi:Rrf2 family protein